MTPMPDSNDLQRTALDLLSSGNSRQAVAELLRVPLATVDSWDRQGRDAAAANPPARDPAGPVAAPASARNRSVRIEPTGFIPQPPVTRALLVGLPLVLGALVLTSDLQATSRQLDLLWLYGSAVTLGLAMGALSIAHGLRSGFELTAHAIVFRDAIRTRQLAYADVDSYAVAKNPQLGVYLLKLAARPGATGLQIWLEPAQVQGGVARWLASMPCTACTSASFYHGSDPERVKQAWDGLLERRE